MFVEHNSGSLDQASALFIAAAWKMLFIDANLDSTNEQLSRVTPCCTKFFNADFSLAAVMYLVTASELEGKSYALS